MIGTVYFLFVNKELGFSPGALGFIFATGGIGSLIGSALTPKFTRWFGAGPALVGSLIMLGFGQGSIVLASSVGIVAVAIMLSQQMTDGFWVYYESTGTSLRQLHAPAAMLGKINGAFESVEFAGLLIGAGLGALVGETIGFAGNHRLRFGIGRDSGDIPAPLASPPDPRSEQFIRRTGRCDLAGRAFLLARVMW